MATSDWVSRLHEIHPIVRGNYIESNTLPWYNARRGRLTASVRSEMIYERKGLGQMREDIERELAFDWQRNEYDNEAMAWGRNNEAGALAALELTTGLIISEPGLLFHPELPYVAATPDGFAVDEEGRRVSIQIKCPFNPQRHLEILHGARKMKKQYWFQVQWEAWVMRCERILFVSYDPRQPLAAQLSITDVPVMLDFQRTFDENARQFQRYVDGEAVISGGQISVLPGHIPEVF